MLRLVVVVTDGWLVASENLTVIVSAFPYTASPLSGSAATNDVINGPAFVPNVPDNVGDVAVDTADVPAEFFRLPPDFTVSVNAPICGDAEPASVMVMTKVCELVHEPE